MCSVDITIGTFFDVVLQILYIASASSQSSVMNHNGQHVFDSDDVLLRNGEDDPELTLGEDTLKIIDDYFVWDKRGLWKTVMETIKNQADGVAVTQDYWDASAVTFVAPAPPWCITENVSSGVETGPIEFCYMSISYDEERIADNATKYVDLINTRINHTPTSAEYKVQRERMVAEMYALLTAHELCHHQYPEYNDDNDPAWSESEEWSTAIGKCQRQVYKDVYGSDPVLYKVATNQPVPAAITLPEKIDSVVSQFPVNFAATVEAHDIWPSLPTGSTKRRVSKDELP